MPNPLKRFRASAFYRQHGRCIYCNKSIWLSDVAHFAAEQNLTTRQARHRQCTAEHLCAIKNGGGNIADNIAAACLFCNLRRHKRRSELTPKQLEFTYARGWHVVGGIRDQLCDDTSTRGLLQREFCFRLATPIGNHFAKPLAEEVVQLRLCHRTERHHLRAKHSTRPEAIGLRQRAHRLSLQKYFNGHIGIRNRGAMQSLKIVAHAQDQPMLVTFDHIDIDIVMAEQCKLGGSVHIMQAWQNLKQLAVVFLIKIHPGSSLISMRKPSLEKRKRTTLP